MNAGQSIETGKDLPRCSCGHDRFSPYVETRGEYGFWGWTALAMGATVVPKKIHFQCGRCREEFDSISDPEELARHA